MGFPEKRRSSKDDSEGGGKDEKKRDTEVLVVGEYHLYTGEAEEFVTKR